MQSIYELWNTPGRPAASLPEGPYLAEVLWGKLLTDEHGDRVYCVCFLFTESYFVETYGSPFAVYRIPLVKHRMDEARQLLKHFGIDDVRKLSGRLPRLYACVYLGKQTEFRTTPSEQIERFEVDDPSLGSRGRTKALRIAGIPIY